MAVWVLGVFVGAIGRVYVEIVTFCQRGMREGLSQNDLDVDAGRGGAICVNASGLVPGEGNLVNMLQKDTVARW